MNNVYSGNRPFIRPRLYIAAVLLACAFLSACKPSTRQDTQPEKVTIAVSATIDATLAQVAQQNGYFSDEGLDVALLIEPYGKLALRDVLDKKAMFATVAETPFMLAVLNGANVSILATIQSSQRDNILLARADTIRSFSDLKDKKIATIRGTTSDYYLYSLLSAHGVGYSNVKLVDMKMENMSAAITRGDVDAIAAFSSYAIPVRNRLGDNGIVFHDDHIYTSSFTIAAPETFLREHPQTAKKFLRALVKAAEFVHNKPEKAQAIVAEFCGIDIRFIREAWTWQRFDISLDQSLLLSLEDEARWAIRNKLTRAKAVPNFLDHIYLDGRSAVSPNAVRILK